MAEPAGDPMDKSEKGKDEESDTPKSAPELVQAWLEAIESASEEEKDWRKSCDSAMDAYRNIGDAKTEFCIYHANVETVVPALYNSTPVPDIRPRFNGDDPVAKFTGDMLEKAITFAIDDYDFSDVVEPCVRDMVQTSRGIARVRYEPQFDEEGGSVVYETARCEYVPWRAFRRSPGRLWSDVSWIAFEHYLSVDEVAKLIAQSGQPLDSAKPLDKTIPFTASASAKGEGEREKEAAPRFGKRAHVWEIWDKEERTVLFICPEYGQRPLMIQPDPLQLVGFFPIPMPMRGLRSTDSLIPLAPIDIYKSMMDDLDAVSRRISRLVKQLRPRGGYSSAFEELNKLAEAGDGELVPMQGMEQALSSGGDLTKLIAWFPMEPTIKAIAELRMEREAIKQSIYEVTGLSDIIRGATKASETYGAQQLKSQWGSLRIQRMQSEAARFARDIFRLKAEVMANHFSIDTLFAMTGMNAPPIQVRDAARQRIVQAQQMAAMAAQQPPMPGQPPMQPPQPSKQDMELAKMPAREEVEALLRKDALRSYKIDIESDSTIRSDLSRNQEQLNGFIQGSGAYFQAIGPAVMQGAMPLEVAIEIYTSFARNFKLGKQAEDALSRWADSVKEGGAGGGKPPGDKPNPDMGAMLGLQAEQLKGQNKSAEMQGKAQLLILQDKIKANEFERKQALRAADDHSLAWRSQFGPVSTQDVGQN